MLTEDANRALGYIVNRMHARIAGGERAGQAAMNSVAAVDPDLYALLLKSGLDVYYKDSENLEELWEYILKHYENPKSWK